ncbi:MAG: glucosaminidase domain-containing protein, partial [Sinomicrobium sp.]|nr:glucosaminidase domain-containing protein [Sinomicrobium sp.]
LADLPQYLGSEAFRQFYEQSPQETEAPGTGQTTPTTSGQTALRIRSSWDREAVSLKLKNAGFGRGKRKAADRILEYIEQHRVIALQDMRTNGIPASVKLAQAILESNAGHSKLAKATKNHFGIKAPAGRTARQKIRAREYKALNDDEFVYQSPAIGAYNFYDDNRYDRFEVYNTVGDSYERHNRLLKRDCRPGTKGCYSWIWETYRVGHDYDITPMAHIYERSSHIAPEEFFNGRTTVPYYAAAAAGLKMSGYATSATYHKKLFYLIETYELWRFDLDLIKALNGNG